MKSLENLAISSVEWTGGPTSIGDDKFLFDPFDAGKPEDRIVAASKAEDGNDGRLGFSADGQAGFARALDHSESEWGAARFTDNAVKLTAAPESLSHKGLGGGESYQLSRLNGLASPSGPNAPDGAFGNDGLPSDDLFTAALGSTAAASMPDLIEYTSKIGIGTWDFDRHGTALQDVENFNFGWYYNWKADPLWSADASAARGTEFVPMIWGRQEATAETFARIAKSAADTLLGFNEPNKSTQANMTVQQAIDLWPQLMATGKRLGSPATTTGQTLGEDFLAGPLHGRGLGTEPPRRLHRRALLFSQSGRGRIQGLP